MDRRKFVKSFFVLTAGIAAPPAVHALAVALERAVPASVEKAKADAICWLEVKGAGFTGRIPLSEPLTIKRDGEQITMNFAQVPWVYGFADVKIVGMFGHISKTICLANGDTLDVRYSFRAVPPASLVQMMVPKK